MEEDKTEDDAASTSTSTSTSAGEEKILVSVRLRPLNDREIEKKDVCDWECINDKTIIYRNSLAERYNYPTAYTFDKVFESYCSTKQVYEEAAKGVVLSVLTGINSTIFAYGQTSSGKTYTMTGITEYTVADVFDYIHKHEERAFVLKFSAMEIYNEIVRDLLTGDGTPLRVLDDPEKGTLVEKLTEETLRDRNHLLHLLSVCEAQRQIGETLLNETSSRSHQILRLTIESSAREFLGKENSSTLSATVNFVDLAGSERASQALSAGTRLKEGCHINRSLLTLGTVIRKLSKGRHGHVPYRDSKLTRILQPSLGGNARTAIICTVSPARSHVEQSRNTLFFASCAKEVATNARVNVVMSDKALVKHLQRELARLESELRGPGPTPIKSDTTALLREKDRKIEKMEKEIKELIKQRDLAQSRVQDLLQVVAESRSSRQGRQFEQPSRSCPTSLWEDEPSVSESSGPVPRQAWEENIQGTREDLEDLCKEVRCIEMEESSLNKHSDLNVFSPALSEGTIPLTVAGSDDVIDQRVAATPQKGDQLMHARTGWAYGALEKKLQDVQKTIDRLVDPCPDEPFSQTETADLSSSRRLQLTRSRSCRATLTSDTTSPWFPEGYYNEKTPPDFIGRDFPGRPEGLRKKWNFSTLNYDANHRRLSIEDSEQSVSVDELKGENVKPSAEDDITCIHTFVAELKEMAKLQDEGQHADDQGEETELRVSELVKTVKDVGLDPLDETLDSPLTWSLEFMRKQMEIIQLWHTCNVSLVHRTYFFLLFKGDPTDRIYMEVELRRLSFIKDTFSQGHHDKPPLGNGHTATPTSSLKALHCERKLLCKRMWKRLSGKEREGLYLKWGIGLGTKQRRLQLAQRLWTDTNDMDHVMESAALVAKLVGLLKPGQALKEMFGLSFTPRLTGQRSYRWRNSLSSLL